MKGQAHSDETRAQVVAAILAGQGVSEVARQYNLPKQTVSDIKRTIAAEAIGQARTEKRERLTDLIESHLRESLKAAIALAQRASSDESWFSKQNAADLGVFYGILTDKSIRILEAAESAAIQQDPDPERVH